MTHYSESLTPGPRALLPTLLIWPAFFLMLWPLSPLLAAVAASCTFAITVAALWFTSPRIEVTDGELRAGRAHISLQYVGTVEAFRGAEARAERGQRADARSFLVLRGWVDPIVKVMILDPNDSTPCWILSTRAPERLQTAIITAKHGSDSQN